MNNATFYKKDTEYLFVKNKHGSIVFPVICFGYEQCSKSKKECHFKNRKSNSIHFVIQGKGVVEYKGEKFFLKEGDYFFMKENEDITYYQNKENPWLYFWIDFRFDGESIPPFISTLEFNNPLKIGNVKDLPLFKEKVNNLFSTKGAYHHLYYQSEAMSFFTMLLDEKATNSDKINTIIDYIFIHYKENDFTMEKIANHFNITLPHLSRYFKKEMKENILDYVVRLRLEEAIRMLENNVPIKNIYSMVGFNSDTYFCKVFKKYFQTTPKKYLIKRK